MKFTDLEFEPHPDWEGTQAVKFFENGYGVSVIMSPYSYGGPDGLYEIAVIKGLEDEWEICYDTPITDDVMGYLTKEDVETVLNQVEKLK